MRLYFSKVKCIWLIAIFCVFYSYLFSYILNVNSVFIKMFPLTGIVIFVMQVVKDRKWYKKRYLWLGFLMIGSYVITILMNYKYNLIENCKNLYWLFMYFFLYYSYDVGQEENGYRRGLYVFNNFFVILNLVTTVLSLLMFWAKIGISLKNEYGQFVLGYHLRWGRLYGITNSVNGFARMAIISFVLLFVNYKLFELSKGWKMIYILNIIFSFLYLVASATRGAELSFSIFLFIYIFGKKYATMKENMLKRFTSSFMKAFAGSILFILCILILNVTLEWSISASDRMSTNYLEIQIEKSDTETKVTKTYMDLGEGGLVRNLTDPQSVEAVWQRRIAWKSVFEDHLLFGIGAANERTYMELYGYPENQSLQIHMIPNIMVFAGLSGLSIYIIMLLCIVVWSIKVLLRGKWNNDKDIGLCYLALTLALTVYTVVMYSNSVMSVLYWLFAGCAMKFIGESKSDAD